MAKPPLATLFCAAALTAPAQPRLLQIDLPPQSPDNPREFRLVPGNLYLVFR